MKLMRISLLLVIGLPHFIRAAEPEPANDLSDSIVLVNIADEAPAGSLPKLNTQEAPRRSSSGSESPKNSPKLSLMSASSGDVAPSPETSPTRPQHSRSSTPSPSVSPLTPIPPRVTAIAIAGALSRNSPHIGAFDPTTLDTPSPRSSQAQAPQSGILSPMITSPNLPSAAPAGTAAASPLINFSLSQARIQSPMPAFAPVHPAPAAPAGHVAPASPLAELRLSPAAAATPTSIFAPYPISASSSTVVAASRPAAPPSPNAKKGSAPLVAPGSPSSDAPAPHSLARVSSLVAVAINDNNNGKDKPRSPCAKKCRCSGSCCLFSCFGTKYTCKC